MPTRQQESDADKAAGILSAVISGCIGHMLEKTQACETTWKHAKTRGNIENELSKTQIFLLERYEGNEWQLPTGPLGLDDWKLRIGLLFSGAHYDTGQGMCSLQPITHGAQWTARECPPQIVAWRRAQEN